MAERPTPGGAAPTPPPPAPEPLRPPPTGPSRGNRGAWVIAAVLAGTVALFALGSGEDSSKKPAGKRAGISCGDPSPQTAGGLVNAYLDGPGSPVAAGRFDCAQVTALWRALRAPAKPGDTRPPYFRWQAAARANGWAMIDSTDPRWRGVNATLVRAAWRQASGDTSTDPYLFVYPRVAPRTALIFSDLEQ